MDCADGGRDLERELRRVVDRLRTLPLDRLDRADDGGMTPAERAREASQQLADLAADATGRPRRPVPLLAVHASADQLAVTGHDVLAEVDAAGQRAALDVLVALRRAI